MLLDKAKWEILLSKAEPDKGESLATSPTQFWRTDRTDLQSLKAQTHYATLTSLLEQIRLDTVSTTKICPHERHYVKLITVHIRMELSQLWQIFKSERTGDLVLSAESGYDLRARYEIPEHHATHGALIAEHLHIPLATNYPIAEQCIRSVDVFPTVLSLCGHTVAEQYIDGRVVR